MKQDQINQLNSLVLTRISPSKIHAVGVFALRDLNKDQKLYADQIPIVFTLSYANFGKLFKEVKELLLERWPNIINGSRFVYPTERLQGLMNHNIEPNYDAIRDELLKDVKSGEEITHDYRLIKD